MPLVSGDRYCDERQKTGNSLPLFLRLFFIVLIFKAFIYKYKLAWNSHNRVCQHILVPVALSLGKQTRSA
jgi:hypothetical protein